jgi:glycosyltransferase involved in cell wall biosynthesis
VQPVHQHAYQVVLAAQERGLLRAFVTALYRTGRGLTSPKLFHLLPTRPRRRAEALASQRWHPEIDPAYVVTRPTHHGLAMSNRLLRGVPGVPQLDLERWAHERFDQSAARWLAQAAPPPSLVHAFEGTALAVLAEARRRGCATVLDVPSAHEFYAQAVRSEGVPFPDRLERARAERRLADVLVAPSSFVEQCLLEHGVPPEHIVVVPFGVDVERFRPRREPDGRFRALFVGRVGAGKGVRYLLEAWSRLALRDAELTIVGGVDEFGRRVLKAFPGVATVTGRIPSTSVHELFARADVFAFPTLAEGSALVSYEAMASGLPVVTTRQCGSVVRDGVDGFIVRARDSDELAARLEWLYRHRNEARDMGASGRQLVEESYTWAHYRERISAVHASRLERPSPAESRTAEALKA